MPALFNRPLLNTLLLLPAGLCLLTLSGCGRGEVTSYEIPKEVAPPPQTPAADPHAGLAAARPSLNWGDLPEGWSPSEAQSSGMRLATFLIAGQDGQSAEMAIIPMGGFAGTDEQLVNMWRMQLGLPELAQAEAGEQGEPFTIGGVEGNLYEMAGAAQEVPTRMVVASVNSDGVNYFFKLIGHDALVTSEKNVFLEFLKGVAFQPASPQTRVPAAPPPAAAPADQRWSAPDHWESLPATQFLLAKFRVPGEAGAHAMVTISQLGGDAGGLLPNVNRWRGQLNLGPVDEAGLEPLIATVKAGSVDATLVSLEGTDLQTGAPGRMLTVVVPLASETWFFKLTGPVAIVNAQADAFMTFVSAARF